MTKEDLYMVTNEDSSLRAANYPPKPVRRPLNNCEIANALTDPDE